jgi:hypothetical protein
MKMCQICPQGVGQWVTKCVVKPLCDVKVTGSKPAGTKNPTKPGDFDGIDAPESWFLKPQVNHVANRFHTN